MLVRKTAALLLLLTACLDVDTIPTRVPPAAEVPDAALPDAEPTTCEQRLGQDPLLGAWQTEHGVCEYFSNGRFSDGCFLLDASGFAEEWARLNDGRYYFGTSSLGSHAGDCTANATFGESCNVVTMVVSCDRRAARTVELTRL